MSRILFDSTIHGRQVPVAIGWDRRLGQMYLSINVAHLDEDDMDDARFSPLMEASSYAMSGGLSIDACKAILASACITTPTPVFDILADHVRTDAGNVILRVDGDDTVHLLYDEEKGINNVAGHT